MSSAIVAKQEPFGGSRYHLVILRPDICEERGRVLPIEMSEEAESVSFEGLVLDQVFLGGGGGESEREDEKAELFHRRRDASTSEIGSKGRLVADARNWGNSLLFREEVGLEEGAFVVLLGFHGGQLPIRRDG